MARYTGYGKLLQKLHNLTSEELANIRILVDLNYCKRFEEEENTIKFKYFNKTVIITITDDTIKVEIKSQNETYQVIFSRLDKSFKANYNYYDYYGSQTPEKLIIFDKIEPIITYSKTELAPYETTDAGILVGFGKYIFTKFATEWVNNTKKEGLKNDYYAK